MHSKVKKNVFYICLLYIVSIIWLSKFFLRHLPKIVSVPNTVRGELPGSFENSGNLNPGFSQTIHDSTSNNRIYHTAITEIIKYHRLKM